MHATLAAGDTTAGARGSALSSSWSVRPGSRILAELLSARTRDHKVPQRSHGQKDFLPDGSQEQEERLRQCREEHWQLLEEERVERLGSLVAAEWKPQEGIVELKSPAGKFWHTMGFAEHGKQCLHPEEALYLLECGSIQLFYRGLPMSVQEAYENLLSQKTVSLLKYQVCLRIWVRTVPTPYERQLNLDSHCQGTERSRSKRRRSSSPRESPQKTRRYHESSRHPTSNDSSKESTKASDPKTAVVEPAPSCSVPREAPARAQDDKKRSSKTFRGDCSDVAPSRWDYTTIAFPNMAADCPQTLLAEPDKRLLPENVTAREVDATRWRRKLNQKHERLTRKEREQLKWESRYKSSVNEDREVRRCSTWQEYKALLKERRRWEERNHPAHLWEQAVTPLVKPDQELSTASVLQQISVFQPSHILDEASLDMKIDFDVYQADVASSFKKNDPGKPNVRMCVRRFDEPIPSLRAVKQLACQSGDVTVVFALVDNGDISFYSFKEFKLPVDVHP
uniref:tRNA splicing endonuclease subunit 54 n=1 Tax=Podarcis muralis TaxID=64176 RepID=A0A670HWE5_PODMU